MSILMQSASSSSLLYSPNASDSGEIRRKGYGWEEPEGKFESATRSFVVRVPKKLRILKLGSRRVGDIHGDLIQNRFQSNSTAGQALKDPSRSFLGRMRVAYQRWMLKAGSASGEFTGIPVAKSSSAPAALPSILSTWVAPPSSKKGTKITDLDPGFKLTAAERKYLEHLTRTAESRRF